MSSNKLDRRLSTDWGVAFMGGAGYKANMGMFELVNLDTGRAHSLLFTGGGIDTILGTASASIPSYTRFTTPTPVSFGSFHSRPATVASVGAIFYGGTRLVVWPFKKAFLGTPMLRATMKGFGVNMPGLGAYVGTVTVQYGSGRRSSNNLPLNFYIPTVHTPVVPLTRVRTDAMEDPKIVLPGDVLFDFDSASLKSGAKKELITAVRLLYEHTNNGMHVVIEGHTDGVGEPKYNEDLSLRRAEAVKNWMIKKKVHNSKNFVTKGLGETEPIAPNTFPDGSDNPQGRKSNRRVTFQMPRRKAN